MEAETAVTKIREILDRARSSGLTDKEITKFLEENGYTAKAKTKATQNETDGDAPYRKACSLLNCLVFKVYPIIFALLLMAYPLFNLLVGAPCLLAEMSPFGEAVTPMVDCAICEGVTGAPRLTNLTQDDFIHNYAYTSRPILVVGAVSDWPATKVFSYDYFKSLYLKSPESLEEDNNSGQFFAYSSNIKDLKDLFSLPSDVATMETEKWYIGW